MLAEGSYGKVVLAKKTEDIADGLPNQIAVKVFQMSLSENGEANNGAGAKDDNMDEDQAGTSDENVTKSEVHGPETGGGPMEESPSTRKRNGMQRHFINEVHYLTKLSHPNIVRVIETATNKALPV